AVMAMAAIATDVQLQPFVSTPGPPRARVSCNRTNGGAKNQGPRMKRGPFVVRSGEAIFR
ncbi:hypothetical protein, partial [Burkholderia stabilis]